jgi:hypothetical protein
VAVFALYIFAALVQEFVAQFVTPFGMIELTLFIFGIGAAIQLGTYINQRGTFW